MRTIDLQILKSLHSTLRGRLSAAVGGVQESEIQEKRRRKQSRNSKETRREIIRNSENNDSDAPEHHRNKWGKQREDTEKSGQSENVRKNIRKHAGELEKDSRTKKKMAMSREEFRKTGGSEE